MSFSCQESTKSFPSTPDICFDLVWLFVFQGWMDGWMDGWMNGWMGGCVFKAGSVSLWSPQCSGGAVLGGYQQAVPALSSSSRWRSVTGW